MSIGHDAIACFEHVIRLAGTTPGLQATRNTAFSNIALCCLHLEDFARGLKGTKVDDRLDIDLLFDRSSSMGEWAGGDRETTASKFDVAKAGLLAVMDKRVKAADRLRLWE